MWKKENKKTPEFFAKHPVGKNDVVYQIHAERPTYAIRDAVVTICVDAKQILCYFTMIARYLLGAVDPSTGSGQAVGTLRGPAKLGLYYA